jgi:predicted tellurium resistance membrane protein TerC
VLALLNRYPILVWAGAGLLGWIAGDLIGTDPDLATPGTDRRGAAFVPVIAWLRRRHQAPTQQA